MSNVAVKVEAVSKLYRIGLREQKAESVAQGFGRFLRSPMKNLRKYRGLYTFTDKELTGPGVSDDILWALHDLTFEVAAGEVVGIVGMNGAGKSTLLKVISRITPPTRGRVTIHGRVSSLLEVGTGFHQELTGRENIYLNGTVLGMRKKEVDAKFDQIVDFADITDFLDTPVKRYSSGMRVRLAFAVAAHLEPEILVVDEVLAVGDAEFQKKCLNKMESVGESGRTVLFVSHNMPAVTRLCSRALLLSEGKIIADGTAHETVRQYLTSGLGTTAARSWEGKNSPGDAIARLRSVRVINQQGHSVESIDIREPVGLEMTYDVMRDEDLSMPYFVLKDEEGNSIFSAIDRDPEWHYKSRTPGRYVSTAWVPGNLLSEGTVYVSASMRTRNRKYRRFHEKDTVAFNIVDHMDGETARGKWAGRMQGVVRPLLDWNTEYCPADRIANG